MAFEQLTGQKRSYTTETEHERTAVKPMDHKEWFNPAHKQHTGQTGAYGDTALVFNNQMANVLMGDVMDRAMKDKMSMANEILQGDDAPQDADDRRKQRGDESGEDEEDGKARDDDLEQIRAKRLAKMRAEMEKKKQWRQQGHGEYTEITEEEFLPTVTKSHFAIVHFYHREFESCKVVDKHLSAIAKKCLSARVVKLDAEKSPFFVTKLAIKTIPTTVVFVNGVAVWKQLGFEMVEGGMECTTAAFCKNLEMGMEEEVHSDTEF